MAKSDENNKVKMKRYILTLLSCVLALVAYGVDDSNTIGKMREELFSVSCKTEDNKQIENQDDFSQMTKSVSLSWVSKNINFAK